MKLDLNDELIHLARAIINTLNEKEVPSEVYVTNINISNGPIVIGRQAGANQTNTQSRKK